MEPFHDIYRKEDPPFLTNRRWRRRRSRESGTASGTGQPPSPSSSPAGTAGSASATASGHPPARINAVLTGGSPQHSHRHHRRHSSQNSGGSRMLWVILGLIFVVYALVLAASVLRSRRRAHGAAAPGKTQSATASTSTNAPAVPDVGRNIAERITIWNQLPDAILEAQTLREKGFADQAEVRLNHALEDAPTAASLKINLAQVLIQEEKFPRAAQLLAEVLETDSSDQKARLMLASVFEHQTNYPAALAVANWMLETEPNSAEAHQIAANAYLNTDRRGMAISHLRKVVSLDPEDTVAQNNLGQAYTQMGQYAKAIQVFNGVLEHNTADSMTYYNLAACYAKQMMAEQVVETLTRAMGVFGKQFVVAWMKSHDFDPIRTDPMFVALLEQQGEKTQAAQATNAPAQNPPLPKQVP